MHAVWSIYAASRQKTAKEEVASASASTSSNKGKCKSTNKIASSNQQLVRLEKWLIYCKDLDDEWRKEKRKNSKKIEKRELLMRMFHHHQQMQK